jgi:hygromycin-B 7''-O-kinase
LPPANESDHRPAIEAICRRHKLPLDDLRKYPTGTSAVFAVGSTHVIKLFESNDTWAAETEQAVLNHLEGRLEVPTPAFVAAGDWDGGRYIVMDQLRGRSLADSWGGLPPAERVSLMNRLGHVVAGLHALPTTIALSGPDWPSFVLRQAEQCVEQQRSRELPEPWLQQIPDFLARQDLPAVATATPVLLHTEIMREHVLVEPSDGGTVLSGLFDFEPARLGAPEYELAAVGVFLAGAEPGLLRSFLLGYGFDESRLTEELQERIFLHTLLHRYSSLRWYLERLPPRRATTLDELAAEWFAF